MFETSALEHRQNKNLVGIHERLVYVRVGYGIYPDTRVEVLIGKIPFKKKILARLAEFGAPGHVLAKPMVKPGRILRALEVSFDQGVKVGKGESEKVQERATADFGRVSPGKWKARTSQQ